MKVLFIGGTGNISTPVSRLCIERGMELFLTWNQIYQAVAAAAECELRAVHIPSDFIARYDATLTGTLLGDKAVSVIFDNSKIKRFVPDFTARIPFSQGIKRTLAWFQADRKRQVVSEKTDSMMEGLLAAFEGGTGRT